METTKRKAEGFNKQDRDTIRLAAHRALLKLILRDESRPLALGGKEDAFRRMLKQGRTADEIADMLDLSPDTVVAALWRLTA